MPTKGPAENRGAFCVLNIVVRTIASISSATACLIVNIGLIIVKRNETSRSPPASAELLFHFHAGHVEAGLERVFAALTHLVTETEIKKLGRQRGIELQVRQAVGAGDLLELAHQRGAHTLARRLGRNVAGAQFVQSGDDLANAHDVAA